MKLSVCCMTVDPPGRVARMLKLLRLVADEVVVAVDSSVDPSTLGPLGEVADQIHRFDFRPPVDWPRAWLAAQCKGEWLFWIDGDEVPSPALVELLPSLIASRDVLQYHIPRRWLFPDAAHWLEETPWWPDFQYRLLRNDPATMWYGETHSPIAHVLPARPIEAPLYHLSCLVWTIAERRAKVRRYDADRPGLVSPGGGSFNEVLQIPEQYATLRPVRVPQGDQAWIDEVLGAGRAAPVPTMVPLIAALVPAKEIESVSPMRSFDSDAYCARIEVLERDKRLAPGVPRPVLVRVHNDGTGTWPWGLQRPWVRVSYHWWRLDGQLLVWDGERTLLPATVHPGESILIQAQVTPPEQAGRLLLELDLVHEGVRWFGCSTRLEVPVANRWQRA